ncbi:hypothetical protein ABEG93_21155 [Pantoea agglomerans]|uniref:hypothetical protein n=1 Tax=Enterobacter agglomerans TaxID=549 RepID=UPI0007E5B400|nr:hypothetical protein [Pantoea agglomerans]WHU90028.1 hypothetical protein A7P62_21395 [Pantoea agglomerans pv. gypsophilae]WNN36581.1 hypothetical protein RIN65_19660 [Pantoea agglomerans]
MSEISRAGSADFSVCTAVQIRTAISVAVISGIFYSMPGNAHSGEAITHAFVAALLTMAACLSARSALSIR